MNNTLLLIDGSSYLYRAFHAMPDLRNKMGEPTGAIYGMVNMLHRLQMDYPAGYMACVFDAKGKTFRDHLYEPYKANRASMPIDLVRQIEPIHAVVKALGWPILMVEGVEADDIIATLAVQATDQGLKTIISTGDKDLAQLVNPSVTLINTMSNEKLDCDGVMTKFGVAPAQIVDYLTLVGDSVDNIPGVAKVGPKTAVKWLTQYGSLDNLLKHADQIKGVVGDNLRATLDWLPQAKVLLTVKTDCDISAFMSSIANSLKPVPEQRETLLQLFTHYEFKTWSRALRAASSATETDDATQASNPQSASASGNALKNFANAGNAENVEPPFETGVVSSINNTHHQYETILTVAQLNHWLAVIEQAELTSIDTETTALNPMQAELVGISLCCQPGVAAYIPLAHCYAGAPEQLSRKFVLTHLKNWLENSQRLKVGQHLKYDSHIFARYGIKLAGIAHDTLLQSYVLEAHKQHGMDNLALRHLHYQPITFEELCGKGASQLCFDQIELGQATEYAAEDADIVLQLHQTLWPQIEHNPSLRFIYESIELPTSKVLQTIENNGVLIDTQLLITQSHELGIRLLELEKTAHALADQPFNLNSPKQLGEIFFTKLGLPVVKKTPSGNPSTDEEVLQKLAENYPLPKVLLEHRSLAKLKSTYTDKLPKMRDPATGRVHTTYSQAVAVTGRLASVEPNLQNIPVRTIEGRRIREAFIAPLHHKIVSADYSQIELRIMAHLSKDPNMLQAFASGEDIHRATAAEIFNLNPQEISVEQRRYAKVINFGLIYGMSAFGLASNLGIERFAAQSYIEKYFVRFAGVKHFMETTKAFAKAHGYVETVYGRRLWLAEINSPNGPRRQAAERAAINAPLQGTAADLIKLAMIAVQNWLEAENLHTRLIMQVHDELVLEVPNAELERVQTELPRLMAKAGTNIVPLKVPLIAEVGTGENWDRAH